MTTHSATFFSRPVVRIKTGQTFPDSALCVIGGFALVLLFVYALSSIAACVGLTSKSPESAASFGFIVLFPLAFVSNGMVPTHHMPGWLQAVADWNPVSEVTAGARHLCGNPKPVRRGARLADAAPCGGSTVVVRRDPARRSAGVELLQAADEGVADSSPSARRASVTTVRSGSPRSSRCARPTARRVRGRRPSFRCSRPRCSSWRTGRRPR